MRLLIAVVIAALQAGPTLAAEGNIYRCIVSNFTSIDAGGPTSEAGFVALNKAKTFDIFELSDRFRVLANVQGEPKGETDYLITVRDEIFGTYAIAPDPSFNMETLAISNIEKMEPGERIKVTLLNQSDNNVNVWYLTCVKAN